MIDVVPFSLVFKWHHQLALVDSSCTVQREPQCTLAEYLRDVVVQFECGALFDVGRVPSPGAKWERERAVAAVEGKSLRGSRRWRFILSTELAAPTAST